MLSKAVYPTSNNMSTGRIFPVVTYRWRKQGHGKRKVIHFNVACFLQATFQIDCIIIWMFHAERRVGYLSSSLVMASVAWLPWCKKWFDNLQQLNDFMLLWHVLEVLFCMVHLFTIKCSGVNFVFCKRVHHIAVCSFHLLEWPGSSGLLSGQRRIHMSSLQAVC